MIDTQKMVKNTILFSLLVQIITGIVSLHGLFITLKEKDRILTDILTLETVVQFIEMCFYLWIAYAVVNINSMTSRRYIDWVITTPTMLLSTIMFMKYQENKEKEEEEEGGEIVTTKQFLQDNKTLIIELFFYNWGMLLFGYIGEINLLSKYISVPLGFIFFIKSFNLMYENYAKYSVLGNQIFIFMLSIWSLYGVVAVMPVNLKNVGYNILDIIAKNFYGLYIYYKILEARN